MKTEKNSSTQLKATVFYEKHIMHKYFYFFILLIFTYQNVSGVFGHPIKDQPQFMKEMRHDNGSLVGEYSYLDKGGDPVQVHYFADDSGYGVELKRMKVTNENDDVKQGKIIQAELLKDLQIDEPLNELYQNTFNVPETLEEDNEDLITMRYKPKPGAKALDTETCVRPQQIKALETALSANKDIKESSCSPKDKIHLYVTNRIKK